MGVVAARTISMGARRMSRANTGMLVGNMIVLFAIWKCYDYLITPEVLECEKADGDFFIHLNDQ